MDDAPDFGARRGLDDPTGAKDVDLPLLHCWHRIAHDSSRVHYHGAPLELGLPRTGVDNVTRDDKARGISAAVDAAYGKPLIAEIRPECAANEPVRAGYEDDRPLRSTLSRRIHQAPFRYAIRALTVPYALFDQSNKGTFRRASDPAATGARAGNAAVAGRSIARSHQLADRSHASTLGRQCHEDVTSRPKLTGQTPMDG